MVQDIPFDPALSQPVGRTAMNRPVAGLRCSVSSTSAVVQTITTAVMTNGGFNVKYLKAADNENSATLSLLDMMS
jgi:hypothetical protein